MAFSFRFNGQSYSYLARISMVRHMQSFDLIALDQCCVELRNAALAAEKAKSHIL